MNNQRAVETAELFRAILERSEQWVREGRMRPRWVGARPSGSALAVWARAGSPVPPPAEA